MRPTSPAIAGVSKKAENPQDLEEKIRREVVAKITGGLLQMVSGEQGEATVEIAAPPPVTPKTDGDYLAPWIDTEECTACGECIKLNPEMFAYNEQEKAFIKDSDAGPYQDLVKAAERCTAQVIHPGLPRDRKTKGIEQWLKRAERFNQ